MFEKILTLGNERRVLFFLNLAGDLRSAGFESGGATEFEVGPDEKVPLPAALRWMGDGVDDLRLNGRALEKTIFIKKREYHRFLLLHVMESKFKFSCPIARGNCTVVFGFPDYGSKKDPNAEFEINISGLNLERGQAEVNRTAVKEFLLRRINDIKLAQFDKCRRAVNQAQVPTAVPSAAQGQLDLDAFAN